MGRCRSPIRARRYTHSRATINLVKPTARALRTWVPGVPLRLAPPAPRRAQAQRRNPNRRAAAAQAAAATATESTAGGAQRASGLHTLEARAEAAWPESAP